jgi:tRNA(Ile)-lysidine synthase
MVLLHAMASASAAEIAAVATFDHGTGVHARHAAAQVEREAARLGVRVITGTAPPGLPLNEGAWRAARHAFLDTWAEELDATVVTAHTRDDEIETVVQRLLRDAGPRGLAGMRAVTAAAFRPRRARPLLTVARADVAAYARAHGVRWTEDPTNATLDFQRNRVRHEILPALERAAPGFGEWCWELGARAAQWREQVDDLVFGLGVHAVAPGSVMVPVGPVEQCGQGEWEVLWPAIAARAGVVMDRRGIARAAAWAPRARAGQVIPLAGDARIVRTASTFVVQGTTAGAPDYILEQ